MERQEGRGQQSPDLLSLATSLPPLCSAALWLWGLRLVVLNPPKGVPSRGGDPHNPCLRFSICEDWAISQRTLKVLGTMGGKHPPLRWMLKVLWHSEICIWVVQR